MLVLTEPIRLSARRFPRPVITLGAFDGIHLGHQKVLARVRREASRLKGTAAVLTFQEHPQRVLSSSRRIPTLTSFWHKLSLLRQAGIKLCLALHFNRPFSRLSPDAFVRQILLGKFRASKVILGHDSRFGHNREGDAATMRGLAKKYGFSFSVVREMRRAGNPVRSSLIREFIERGHLARASKLLGRPYSIFAKVVRGTGRGRSIGFPTANLDPAEEALPPGGVYAVLVRNIHFLKKRMVSSLFDFKEFRDESFRPAVLNLGTRPTFGAKESRVVPEVHILDFKGNLYGRTLEVRFIRRLRKEKAFPDARALSRQIRSDINRAIPILAQAGFAGRRKVSALHAGPNGLYYAAAKNASERN